MTQEKSKNIFFWTLVALFFITSATLILYAFGYRFSPSRGVFVYAGSVSLKTTPQTVDVYINKQLMPNQKVSRINNSIHIDGIDPGNYLLEVKAAGFKDWSKKISIHSGVSTEFWNIILTKDSYAREDYNTPGIERFFISPHKNLAAFTQYEDENFVTKIFDPSSLEIKGIFAANDYTFTNNDKENIEWSPQAHRLIIPVIQKESGEKNYFVVTLETGEIINLREAVGEGSLSHVRWDPDTKNALFYMTDDKLVRVDLDNPENKKLIAEKISSYDLSSSGLFYFQLPQGLVYQNNFTGTDMPTQITEQAPFDMSNNNYELIVYDKKRIVLHNRNTGKLYIYNAGETDIYFQELSSSAKGSQFSDDGKKLLFWTDRDIAVYFLRKWEVQPIRTENEVQRDLTRLSSEIKNVQWTRDYEHVLFTNDKKIKLIELDPRDKRNMSDIISLNDDNSLLVSNNADGKLYYTEKDNDGQINLHSIYFPERATFLGIQQ